jgi:prepilin-type N-terminal cleavage/methylation domain-containing protein
LGLSTNRSGFSLVELLTAVAIIGILATIVVPAYKSYQIRARQTESKHALSIAYVAQKSAYAEYSTYVSCLGQFGFDIHHKWNCIDSAADPQSLMAYYSTQVVSEEGDANWGNVAVQNMGFSCVSGIYDCGPSRWFFKSMGYRQGGSCDNTSVWNYTEALMADPTYTYVTQNTFKVVSSGFPKPCASAISSVADLINKADIWTIDQFRMLHHVKPPN